MNVTAIRIKDKETEYSLLFKDGKFVWYCHLTGAAINAGEGFDPDSVIIPESVVLFGKSITDKIFNSHD